MPKAADLLAWYDAHRRDLPWRKDRDPYHVWLSEIMLQQTRAVAVIPYYNRFLAALPTISALAQAPEDQYLKLWEGLGYYSRVRNLQKAAQVMMEQQGGQMPQTSAELEKLPGIGPYTAAAIASIAFDQPVAAVDGNLLRLYARMTADPADVMLPETRRKAKAWLESWIDPKRPGDWNQAMMDLGAGICSPNGTPDCDACPLRAACQAHQERAELSYPVRAAKKPRQIVAMTAFVIHHSGEILLRKRPAKGLLAGLYEFPWAEGHLAPKEAIQAAEALGVQVLRIQKRPPAVHIFTHKEWHLWVYEIRADEFRPFRQEEGEGCFRVSTTDLRNRIPIPSAFAGCLRWVPDEKPEGDSSEENQTRLAD